jgi:glycosyltransferase involved in cell wall biosynthesis
VKLLKKIEKYVADGADKIITPSEYLKGIITDWGVDPAKIRVIYNGFHMETFREQKDPLRKRLGLAGTVIVSAGRLVPWKGMKELIEAFEALLQTVPEATLVIVGDGPEMESLKSQVASRKLQDFVRFTGKLAQKDVFRHIRAADVFVLNTAYEGFSHQLLETMALGTPIITTRIGGNPELITDEENGILIAPNDRDAMVRSMTALISDAAQAAAFSRAGKERVKGFGDLRMLERVAEELRS